MNPPSPSCRATTRRAILLVLLFLGGLSVCFRLRDYGIPGGDTAQLLDPRARRFSPRWGEDLAYNVRAPLAHMAIQSTYRLLGDLPLSFDVVCSVCGGLWLVLLALFRRTKEFWVINLTSLVVLNFIGHKEYYAPVAVALLLCCLLLRRALRPGSRVKLWHVVAAFGLAVHCHKLAVFYLPAMLVLVVDPHTRKLRPFPRRECEKALLTLIAFVILLQLPMWLEAARLLPGIVIEYDNRILELLTLPKGWADRVAARSVTGAYQNFYFGSLDHFMYYAGFLLVGAPVGLILIGLRWRSALSTGFLGLTVAAGCSLIWTFFWHPHMTWLDWDLFCIAAVPINVLAGLLYSDPLQPPEKTGD